MSPAHAIPERINISHKAPDAQIQQVLDKIEREFLVSDALGADGVEGVIDRLCSAPRTRVRLTLDLIAHSRRGVLHLGGWSVDGSTTTVALRNACVDTLADLDLAAIRLLGCNTALSVEGQAAMRRLHELFAVPVLGTKVPISARDFDAEGFRADAILTDQDNVPPPAGPTLQSVGRWFGRFARVVGETLQGMLPRLRAESRAEVVRDRACIAPRVRWAIREVTREQLEAILDHAEPDVVDAPGLLALPDCELVAPVSAGAGRRRYHRVTVLLDGYWLRVYPIGRPEGVVVCTDGDPILSRVGALGRALVEAGDP